MEWISIKDRLPEENTWVLCFLPHCGFSVNMIFSLKFFYHTYSLNGEIQKIPMFENVDRGWRVEDITHWMKLPEAPSIQNKDVLC